jgi:hypothetical protein
MTNTDVCCIPTIFHRVKKIREGALQYYNPRASREVSAAGSHTQLDLCKINNYAAPVQWTEISHPRVSVCRPPQGPPTDCNCGQHSTHQSKSTKPDLTEVSELLGIIYYDTHIP